MDEILVNDKPIFRTEIKTVQTVSCKIIVNQLLFARTSFRDLLVMNWLMATNLCYRDYLKQTQKTLKDWFTMRNICDDDVLAKFVKSKISCTWVKVGLQKLLSKGRNP